MEKLFKNGKDLTVIELSEISKFIEIGGEVKNPRLKEAALVGFYKEDDLLFATATMKLPNANYKANIFKKAETILSNEDFEFELGYVFVTKNCRGKGYALSLCRELCKEYCLHNIFATTKSDNYSMQQILTGLGFKKEGKPYPSTERKNVLLNLFIKIVP